MPYEYKILSPTISSFGRVRVGYRNKIVTKKNLFGKDISHSEYEEVFQEEVEWLNDLGKDGWELIQIDKNSFSHDIRNYYFKRLNRTLAEKRDDDLNEILDNEKN